LFDIGTLTYSHSGGVRARPVKGMDSAYATIILAALSGRSSPKQR
jgi:hypothetical protein